MRPCLVPLSHHALSIFYRGLAQQLAAGLTLAQALRASSPAPAGDCLRLAALAESGSPVERIVAEAGDWLPGPDRPFLVAAAGAGRLPLVLVNLADRHERLGKTRQRVIFASLYPLAVFHFGVVVFAFVRLIDFERGLDWSGGAFLSGVAAVLLPVWGGAALLWALLRGGNAFAHGLLDLLPAIGGYRSNQALADFAFALGNLLEAGAPIGPAWSDAGEISRSPRLRRAAEAMRIRVEQGLAPGAHIGATRAFPADFVARYQTGEATGSLETGLIALAADYQERANGRLAAASVLYPGLLFAAVAGMIGYIVIGFALRYVAMLNEAMQGI